MTRPAGASLGGAAPDDKQAAELARIPTKLHGIF